MAMCFMLLSLASSSVLQLAQANSTCITINDTIIDPVNSYWQMVPNLSYALSFLIYLYSFIEFVMCQSPYLVKVIVQSILFACVGPHVYVVLQTGTKYKITTESSLKQCIYMYVCMMYVCMYVCMYRYVCMYVCMYRYVRMYVCIYKYLCKNVCGKGEKAKLRAVFTFWINPQLAKSERALFR